MNQIDPNKFRTADSAKNHISLLDREYQNGSGLAGYSLALIFSEGNALMSDEVKSAICVSDTMALDYFIRSYELLKKEAQSREWRVDAFNSNVLCDWIASSRSKDQS